MKLVIDISEEFYDVLTNEYYDSVRNTELEHLDLVQKIKNGIMLPKGHGRLIDADELLKKSEWFGEELTFDNPYPFGTVAVDTLDIDKAPTIIEADKGDTE